ncbi:unnamed protein product [marine sediment metagenome]|uniref:Uncharacterized protein n=1 Tax=marine sediment metagenome TaxID=412755 RepID=X0YUK3_9ZZZZ
MQTSKYIWPKFVSMVTLVTLSIIFVKYFGFKGVIYANILMGIIYILVLYYLNYRKVKYAG